MILWPAFCFTFPSDTVHISTDSHGFQSQTTQNGLVKISRVSCASHNTQKSSEVVVDQGLKRKKQISKNFASILCFAQHTGELWSCAVPISNDRNGRVKIWRVSCASHNTKESSEAPAGACQEIKTNFGRLDLISWQSQGAAGKTKIQEGTEPPEFARKSKPTLRAKLVLISWQRQHHHTEIKTSFFFCGGCSRGLRFALLSPRHCPEIKTSSECDS